MVKLVAARLGALAATDGASVEADATFETMPSVLFDAAVIPDGEAAATELSALGHAREFSAISSATPSPSSFWAKGGAWPRPSPSL